MSGSRVIDGTDMGRNASQSKLGPTLRDRWRRLGQNMALRKSRAAVGCSVLGTMRGIVLRRRPCLPVLWRRAAQRPSEEREHASLPNLRC